MIEHTLKRAIDDIPFKTKRLATIIQCVTPSQRHADESCVLKTLFRPRQTVATSFFEKIADFPLIFC